jgi:hypothetical protein
MIRKSISKPRICYIIPIEKGSLISIERQGEEDNVATIKVVNGTESLYWDENNNEIIIYIPFTLENCFQIARLLSKAAGCSDARLINQKQKSFIFEVIQEA